MPSVLSSALICAIVPVIVTDDVPLPLTPCPAGAGRHRQRALGHRQRHRLEPPSASTSLTDMPGVLEIKRRLLGRRVRVGVIIATGASFTAVTSTVIVFGLWSVSTPPAAVPPLSCTWKVKDA